LTGLNLPAPAADERRMSGLRVVGAPEATHVARPNSAALRACRSVRPSGTSITTRVTAASSGTRRSRAHPSAHRCRSPHAGATRTIRSCAPRRNDCD